MTIDKAIEIINHEARGARQACLFQIAEAEELGIEALKRIKDYRKRSSTFATPLLPGETEE